MKNEAMSQKKIKEGHLEHAEEAKGREKSCNFIAISNIKEKNIYLYIFLEI